MAFSKLTVLALLALQSVAVFTDPDVIVTVTTRDGKIPVVRGSWSTLKIEFWNREPKPVTIGSVNGTLSTIALPGRNPEIKDPLRAQTYALVVPSNAKRSLKYEFYCERWKSELRHVSALLNLHLQAVYSVDDENPAISSIFSKSVYYYPE